MEYNIQKSAYIQEVKQDKATQLNFENEESEGYRENAEGKRVAAKVLAQKADECEAQGDISTAKQLNKNATQMNIESIELNHKEVIAADESENIVTDPNGTKRDKVLHSHNLNLLDRTVSNANFSLMSTEEKDDITNLFKPGNNNAPYNAVRYNKISVSKEQRIKSEKVAANVNKKCQRLRDRSKQQQDSNTITIDGITYRV
jgi:hypothetical protein